MDISNESKDVFIKHSDVHHSTMNELQPDSESAHVDHDQDQSSGAPMYHFPLLPKIFQMFLTTNSKWIDTTI